MTKLTVTLRNFAKAPILVRSCILIALLPEIEDLNKKKTENFQVVLCTVECALSLLNGHINQNCMTTHGQHTHKFKCLFTGHSAASHRHHGTVRKESAMGKVGGSK